MLHPSALPKPLLQLPLLDKAAARLLSDAQFADLRKEMDAFRSENAWVEQSALFRCLPLGGGGGGGGHMEGRVRQRWTLSAHRTRGWSSRRPSGAQRGGARGRDAVRRRTAGHELQRALASAPAPPPRLPVFFPACCSVLTEQPKHARRYPRPPARPALDTACPLCCALPAVPTAAC